MLNQHLLLINCTQPYLLLIVIYCYLLLFYRLSTVKIDKRDLNIFIAFITIKFKSDVKPILIC